MNCANLYHIETLFWAHVLSASDSPPFDIRDLTVAE